MTLVTHYGLFLVALIIFGGELGLPVLIPGEIALLVAGSQVIHSPLQLIGALILFGIVDITATTTIHAASRTAGNRLLKRLLCFVTRNSQDHEEVIGRWRRRLCGHDTLVVFVTRLIPMFRLYASITTGLIRIHFRDFLLGAAPAAFVWAATPLTVGYVLRSHIQALTAQFGLMIHIVIGSSVFLMVAAVLSWWIRQSGSTGAALRRLRLTLGLAAVFGACARLMLVMLETHSSIHRFLFLPAVATWVTVISLIALALVWVAAHDLRAIRMRHVANIGMTSAASWVTLMILFSAVATWGSSPYSAL